ncbi:hypothetical protein NLJ89_g5645 [Agrocybe chaxingu]|uniref:C-CAP/cofactor C-like domain-containing protein n=1 Tax=Agrocybe chaxingu TaxID=84603 RepID=A0A9W8K064_9AGAR|nr:hypothetical protein NLJ89_g5645 [Agrocybe chaxingu]
MKLLRFRCQNVKNRGGGTATARVNSSGRQPSGLSTVDFYFLPSKAQHRRSHTLLWEPVLWAAKKASAAAPAAGATAVFAQINRGEDVTKGLRKVDKSEMTHKNPALRAGSVVPASTSGPSPSGKRPIKPSKPSALAGKKPPKFVLDGTKWLIEHQEHETLTVDNVEINHSVNVFGCKGTTIVIKGKVNAVNILNSSKTAVLVHSVVASVGVTASPSFTLQVTGTCPMIQLDTTDSGQIYLSKDSLGAEITTAKCSAINISLPVEGEEDGIFEEQPVPEMFKTVVQNGKLVTTIVEHAG